MSADIATTDLGAPCCSAGKGTGAATSAASSKRAPRKAAVVKTVQAEPSSSPPTPDPNDPQNNTVTKKRQRGRPNKQQVLPPALLAPDAADVVPVGEGNELDGNVAGGGNGGAVGLTSDGARGTTATGAAPCDAPSGEGDMGDMGGATGMQSEEGAVSPAAKAPAKTTRRGRKAKVVVGAYDASGACNGGGVIGGIAGGDDGLDSNENIIVRLAVFNQTAGGSTAGTGDGGECDMVGVHGGGAGAVGGGGGIAGAAAGMGVPAADAVGGSAATNHAAGGQPSNPYPYNTHAGEYNTFQSMPMEFSGDVGSAGGVGASCEMMATQTQDVITRTVDGAGATLLLAPPSAAHAPPSSLQSAGHDCNNDINRPRCVALLKDFEMKSKNHEWPSSTSICCYWCCHQFNSVPFGIPVKYVDKKFYVFGCFCSLECAAAYNFQTCESHDERWERYHLINVMSHKIGHVDRVRSAPCRLALKMFGGFMDIDAFRSYCKTSTKVLSVNFPPMMTLTQQIEELNECDVSSEYKYIPLDIERINKYREKIVLRRTKPVTEFKNTLDSLMNLKIHAQGT